MRVMRLHGPDLEQLQPDTVPKPAPGSGEVVLRLRAAALNFLDVAIARGVIPGIAFPIIPVTDAAGEIASIGPGVLNGARGDVWQIGDRVVPHFLPFWQDGAQTAGHTWPRRGVTLPGSLAEFVRVPASSLVRIPDHLSFEEAATLPIAATTAWRAVRSAGLGPGMTAVVQGTGGVSIFALQFAKALGARVIVTSSSDDKLERARALGADDIVNYRTDPDWDAAVLRLTHGRGADLVLETGGTQTFPRSLNAAAMNGTVFVIGFLTGQEVTFDVLPMMEKSLRLIGNTTGPIAALRDAARAIEAHAIRPVIDRIFPWEQAHEAYTHLAGGGAHMGKIVITF